MRAAFLWVAFAGFLSGQDKDDSPFGLPEDPSDQIVYDFDRIHQWDDVLVSLDGENDPKSISWLNAFVSSHKGVDGKAMTLWFRMDAEAYEKALQHPEHNRGIKLIAGNRKYPLLECDLRPFSVENGHALFIVRVPLDRLQQFHVAFIPRDQGKKRYLYDLIGIAAKLATRDDAEKK